MLLNNIIKINNKIKNSKIPFSLSLLSSLPSLSPTPLSPCQLEVKIAPTPMPTPTPTSGLGRRHEPESRQHSDLQPRGRVGSRRRDRNSGGGRDGSRNGDCNLEEVTMEAHKSEDVAMASRET